MARIRSLARASLAGAILFVSGVASAEPASSPSGQDIATAQALFDEGKRLMQLGKHDEACPKLVESQRLDPGGGTLLAIGLCHEGQGKTATAWADFNVALSEARKDRRPDRESAALEHIKALEGRLTRVRMVVASKVDGLEVKRDGGRVGEAQWGTPLPVDPGEHLFEARAPGKKTWQKTITIVGEARVIDVEIPALEPELVARAPAAQVASRPASTSPAAASTSPDGADRGSSGNSQIVWAAVAGGVGLVATGVGVALGVSASAKWSDAEAACPNRKCTTASARRLGEEAGTAADLSTVFFTIGAMGLATGVTLYLTAPSARERGAAHAVRVSPVVGRETAGLSIGGQL